MIRGVQGSHPARVRGLKHETQGELIALPKVAPRTGAWIETVFFPLPLVPRRRRTPHGCVD